MEYRYGRQQNFGQEIYDIFVIAVCLYLFEMFESFDVLFSVKY